MVIEQWGFFFSMCQTYCDTEQPFIMVITDDPWHSHLLPNVWQWICHYLSCPDPWSNPDLRIQCERYTTTQQRLSRCKCKMNKYTSIKSLCHVTFICINQTFSASIITKVYILSAPCQLCTMLLNGSVPWMRLQTFGLLVPSGLAQLRSLSAQES